MAKRYIDTNFFKSPFVRGLKGSLKGLYTFIICDCSGAGIWTADFEIASVYIDSKVTYKEFEDAFLKSGKSIDLSNGKYFFPDFIEHQYPKGLSEKNPAQTNFILELKKYNLIDENFKVLERPFKGSMVMVKEKVMEEVKEKVMEKVKEKVMEKEPEIEKLIYPFDSENFKNIWGILVKEKKWKKKSNMALQAALKKLSEQTEEDAIKMIENTIAGEWQGLFELKNKNNGKSKNDREAGIKRGLDIISDYCKET